MKAHFELPVRITVTIVCDEGYRQIQDVFEMDRRTTGRGDWKLWYETARQRTMISNNPTRCVEVTDPSKPWVRPTDRQNRIADARICLEQIKIHRSRLRAALSGNYEGVL